MEVGNYESATSGQVEDSDVAAERQRVNQNPASVSPQGTTSYLYYYKTLPVCVYVAMQTYYVCYKQTP